MNLYLNGNLGMRINAQVELRASQTKCERSELPRVPSMTIDQQVQVLWEGDRTNPSEPQGAVREDRAESSGERDLWGDVQESDARRSRLGRAGLEPRNSYDLRLHRISGARAGTANGSYLGRSHLSLKGEHVGGGSGVVA